MVAKFGVPPESVPGLPRARRRRRGRLSGAARLGSQVDRGGARAVRAPRADPRRTGDPGPSTLRTRRRSRARWRATAIAPSCFATSRRCGRTSGCSTPWTSFAGADRRPPSPRSPVASTPRSTAAPSRENNRGCQISCFVCTGPTGRYDRSDVTHPSHHELATHFCSASICCCRADVSGSGSGPVSMPRAASAIRMPQGVGSTDRWEMTSTTSCLQPDRFVRLPLTDARTAPRAAPGSRRRRRTTPPSQPASRARIAADDRRRRGASRHSVQAPAPTSSGCRRVRCCP